MIIRGGENIYPSEIEACLTTLPLCLDAAVVGRPDPKWGEEVAAVVQVPPGTETNSQLVIEHCQQQLAAFKVPVQVIFTEKPLPRNALRKLLKNKIIAEYYPQ
jgi:long-chain acyl-CoA synthetase